MDAEYEELEAEALPSRESAKIYCASFLQWMRQGLIACSKGKSHDQLNKAVDGLENAFTELITSYETEIQQLRGINK